MQLLLPKWIVSQLRDEFPSTSIQHTIKLILKYCLDTEEGDKVIKEIIRGIERGGRGIPDSDKPYKK